MISFEEKLRRYKAHGTTEKKDLRPRRRLASKIRRQRQREARTPLWIRALKAHRPASLA